MLNSLNKEVKEQKQILIKLKKKIYIVTDTSSTLLPLVLDIAVHLVNLVSRVVKGDHSKTFLLLALL